MQTAGKRSAGRPCINGKPFFARRRRRAIHRSSIFFSALTSADARRLLRRSRRSLLLLLILLRLGLFRSSTSGWCHCDDGRCAGHFYEREREKKVELQQRRQFFFSKNERERPREKEKEKKTRLFSPLSFLFFRVFSLLFLSFAQEEKKKEHEVFREARFCEYCIGRAGRCMCALWEKEGAAGWGKSQSKKLGLFFKKLRVSLLSLSPVLSPSPSLPLSSLSLSFSLSLSAARARKRGAWRTEKILRIILDEQ